jgi:predicted acylesterase/phospholipase RssA
MKSAWKPRGISLSSSGVRAVGHLGCLAGLSDAGLLDDVTDWYGCSGGAIAAFAGALGVSGTWLRHVAEVFDLRPLGTLHEEELMAFPQTWGIRDANVLQTYLGRFFDTWEPQSSAWTFADLKRERPHTNLFITATNLTRGTQAIFSHETTPTMRILEAVQVSGSVPFFYTPWVSPSGDIFCDGAIHEYFPWTCVRKPDDTLVVVCEEGGIAGRHEHTLGKKPLVTVFDYIERVIDVTVNVKRRSSVPRYWIALNNDEITTLEFNMTKEQRLGLFYGGMRAATSWAAFRTHVLATDVSGAAGFTSVGTEGTPQIPRPYEGPCRAPCCHRPSGESGWGSPECRIPPSSGAPSRDLHTPSRRSDRRWSL